MGVIMRYSHEDDYEDEEKNFFDNDDNNDDMDFDEDELEDMMDEKIYYEEQKIKIIRLAIKQQNLKRKILLDVIATLQKSFWWNFCPWKTRLTWITRTFEKFSELIFGSEK